MPLGPGFTVENRACVALYDLPARTPPGASPPPSSTAFAPTRPDGEKSQCTYRCVVLPDSSTRPVRLRGSSQCTYRCVVLPDSTPRPRPFGSRMCLNAPTGAWCSLTRMRRLEADLSVVSMHLQVRGAP